MRPKPPLDLQAVIFDLDGVVFDSLHCNIVLYNHILEQVGLPPTAEEAAEVIHRESMERSLAHFMGWGEKFEQAMAYWRQLDATPFINELRPFPRGAGNLGAPSQGFPHRGGHQPAAHHKHRLGSLRFERSV
jgi:phosphoglycolate phosphatase